MPASMPLRRLALATLTTSLFMAAHSGTASAASVTVCQKKSNGALRVVKPSKKCRRSETRLTIPTGELTSGPAGPQGARGPGAARFAGDGAPFGLGGTSTAIDTFTIGGVQFRFVCGNALLANVLNIQVTAPSAGRIDATHTLAENTADAVDGPLALFDSQPLVAGSQTQVGLNIAAGDATSNRSVFTAVVDAGSRTITLTGSTFLPDGGAGCSVRGLAVVND